MKAKLILALDFPTSVEALEFWSEHSRYIDSIGYLKIGLGLFCSEGPAAIKKLQDPAWPPIFLDLKLPDTPKTNRRALFEIGKHGVEATNIYFDGCHRSLSYQKSLLLGARETDNQPKLWAIAARSTDDPDLVREKICQCVEQLLEEPHGYQGVILPGWFVAGDPSRTERLRNSKLTIVATGVRSHWVNGGDHQRVVSPAEAEKTGADYIVMGEQVTDPPKGIPTHEAFERTIAELEAA